MITTAFCVYCGLDKPWAEFNKEHVLPKSFGHFKGALTLARPKRFRVCAGCNSHFGETLDLGLGRGAYESLLRFQNGVASAQTASGLLGRRFDVALPPGHPLAPLVLRFVPATLDSSLSVAPAPQLRVELKDGTKRSILEADVSTQLPQLVPLLKKNGVSLFWWAGDPDAESRLKGLIADSGVALQNWRPDPLLETLKPGELEVALTTTIDSLVTRAIAKIAFEYYIWHVQTVAPAIIQGLNTDILGRFILDGSGDWRTFVRPSHDPILANETSTMRRTPGHLLTLDWGRRQSSPILARVTLFNDLIYDVLIAASPPRVWVDIGIGHVYDITKREVRQLLKGRYIIPPPWLIPATSD